MKDCKPGGCLALGCEGGFYCFNEDGTPKPDPAPDPDFWAKLCALQQGIKMNVQPYNQKEQDAATAAGFPVIRDWAEGLTLLRLGFRKMDDALPGRNEALAAEGYKQAVEGTKIIHDFFKARGLDLSA